VYNNTAFQEMDLFHASYEMTWNYPHNSGLRSFGLLCSISW